MKWSVCHTSSERLPDSPLRLMVEGMLSLPLCLKVSRGVSPPSGTQAVQSATVRSCVSIKSSVASHPRVVAINSCFISNNLFEQLLSNLRIFDGFQDVFGNFSSKILLILSEHSYNELCTHATHSQIYAQNFWRSYTTHNCLLNLSCVAW